MNVESRYLAWKRSKSTVEVPEGFADEVMDRIRSGEVPWHLPSTAARILDWTSSRPAVKAALFVLAALLGFIRLSCILCVLLA